MLVENSYSVTKIERPYVRILVLRTPFVRIPSDVEYVLCGIHKHDNIANGTCYVILQSRILSDTRRNVVRDKEILKLIEFPQNI